MFIECLEFCYFYLTSQKFRKIYAMCRIGFYKIKGVNNKIFFQGKSLPFFLKIKGLTIKIQGNNNVIKIGDNTSFKKTLIELEHEANNAEVYIGNNCTICNLVILGNWASNHICYIGNHCGLYGGIYAFGENNACLKIGNDCLIANTVSLWAADGHSVIDKRLNKVINLPKKPLLIGDHCWLGHGCRLTKNGSIPSHTICAGGAVVTKTFTEEYTIIGGNPAKILKRNVDWDETSAYYKDLELKNV